MDEAAQRCRHGDAAVKAAEARNAIASLPSRHIYESCSNCHRNTWTPSSTQTGEHMQYRIPLSLECWCRGRHPSGQPSRPREAEERKGWTAPRTADASRLSRRLDFLDLTPLERPAEFAASVSPDEEAKQFEHAR